MHESSIGVASLYTRTSMNPDVSRHSEIRGRRGPPIYPVHNWGHLYTTGVSWFLCLAIAERATPRFSKAARVAKVLQLVSIKMSLFSLSNNLTFEKDLLPTKVSCLATCSKIVRNLDQRELPSVGTQGLRAVATRAQRGRY